MLLITRQGRRPMHLDSDISFELKTNRPAIPGAYERLEEGDRLEIKAGHSIHIIIKDGVLGIRKIED